MAKIKSSKRNFFQKIPKGQRVSLVLLALMVVVLPLAFLASQLQTRLSPRAFLPTPKPMICKTGVNSWSAGVACKISTPSNSRVVKQGLLSARYQCSGNNTWYTASLNRCATREELQAISTKYCASHSICTKPTPTITTRPTPTVTTKPTPTITTRPTPTPTPIVSGQVCGGIAGIKCPKGSRCKYDGSYPYARGVCVP